MKRETGLTNDQKIDLFNMYYEIQMSGKYNMVTQATTASMEAGLTIDEYVYVINNYDELHKLSRCDN